MPYYESVFLVRADVSSQQVEALAKSFTDIVADNGGAVTKTEHWGLRTLAYKIKKNRKAHYVLFNIDSPAPAVLEMERNMRLNEDVLRTLTVRVDDLDEEPSAIIRAKGRDDRGRRDRGPRSDGPSDGRSGAPATARDGDEKEKSDANQAASSNPGAAADGAKPAEASDPAPGQADADGGATAGEGEDK